MRLLLHSGNIKALANEDTLLRTHCCRHKCFPVCPRAKHLLRTQILCLGHKNSDFVQKHFVSVTNVSQIGQPKKHHGQQCVRNNVSSFTRAFRELEKSTTATSLNESFNEENNSVSCARAL